MSQDFIDATAEKLMLLNTYGVTEATVYQTTHQISPGDHPGIIGQPLDGNILFLAGDGWNEVEEGEICIAGPQLAIGYIRQPDLTKQAFVDHPKYGRAYRTGDLAIRTDKGFKLIGRRDHQVKIRGVRMELGEIEAGLIR